MFSTLTPDTLRYQEREREKAAASALAYSVHLADAREALTREPGKALRNPCSTRYPTIRASDLYSTVASDEQCAVLADIVSRAAMAGDAQAMGLIDQLAQEHADRNSEECGE